MWDEPTLPEHDRVHLARRLSMSRFARGDLDGALAAVSDAEELAHRADARAPACKRSAPMLLASNGRPQEALAVLAAIDDGVTDVTDGRLRIELASARSTACLTVGRFDEAWRPRNSAPCATGLPEWLARRGMATHLSTRRTRRLRRQLSRGRTADRGGARAGARSAARWRPRCGSRSCSVRSSATAATGVRRSTISRRPRRSRSSQDNRPRWCGHGSASPRVDCCSATPLPDAEALEPRRRRRREPGRDSWSTAMRTAPGCWRAKATSPRARRLLVEVAEVVRDDGIWTFEASLHHDLVRFGDPDLAVDRLDELAQVVEGPLIQAFADHAWAAVAMDRAATRRAIDQFEAHGPGRVRGRGRAGAGRLLRSKAMPGRRRPRPGAANASSTHRVGRARLRCCEAPASNRSPTGSVRSRCWPPRGCRASRSPAA